MTTFNGNFFTFVATFLFACTTQCAAFTPASIDVNNFNQRQTAVPGLFMAATATPTLTDETTWKLRFVMRGLPTTKGRKVDEIFNIYAQFIEEEGYEPPQGYLKQVKMTMSVGDEEESTEDSQFQITSSRWLLSEDPDDRKDGLWVSPL